MITAWTKHIKDPKEKEEYAESLRRSRWILDHLTLLLNEMERDLETSELNPKTYDFPNWDYRMADFVGQKKNLRKIKKLLNLDQKEEQ